MVRYGMVEVPLRDEDVSGFASPINSLSSTLCTDVFELRHTAFAFQILFGLPPNFATDSPTTFLAAGISRDGSNHADLRRSLPVGNICVCSC